MKSTIKRLLALILALSMCLSLLSANVWASVASEAAEAPVTEAVEPEAEESAEEDEGQSKEDESSTEEGKNSPNEDKSEEKVTPEEEPEESEEEVTPEEEPDESEEEVTPEEEPEESEEEVTPEEEPGMSLTTQADDAISRLYIGSSAEVTSPGVVSDTGGTGTATVSLEDNTVVVTLDNFVYSGSVPCSYSSSGYTFNHYASLFYDGSAPLKILLKGENKLEAASITSGYQAVLLTNSKNLTIDNVDSASPGSLIVKYSTTSSDHARGIHLNGGRLTIAGGKVTAIGGTGTSAGSNPGVTASKLSVTGGELIAAGGSSSNGLSSGCTVTGSVSITGSDAYTVSGDTVTPGTTRPLTSSDRTSYMYISAHAHSFTYTASGSSITAACTEGCDITEGLTLTISAPTGDLTADGTTEFAATLNDDYNTTAFPGDYPITYTKDGQSFDGTPKDAGTYTASVTAGTGDGASSASVSFTIAEPAPALTIGSVEDWNTFAASVKAGNTYSGQIIRMTADVGPVTTMVGGTFSGTFDGDGHTLTVNISGGNASVATFETVSNATFQDLTLAGSVTSAGIHIAALVKSANGTCTIKHVNVNANVNCSQAYIGGFIGHAGTGNTINIENSVFSGSINKTGSGQGNFIGGFIGWSQTCTATISNCAFTGSYSNIKSFNNIGFSYNAPKSITVTNFYSNASEVFVANVNHGTRLYIPSSAYPNAVALVENGDNRTIYTTFSDAVTAWSAGTTLMPLTDVTATDAITTSDTKTLDLNGKTLTLNSEMSVAEGTLTIQGTSGGEMVRQNATLIRVSEGATLDIESGTISGTGTKDRAAIHVYGTVNLNGGTVQSASSNAFSLLANVVLNLNGGTVSSNSDSSTMTTSSAVLAKNESNITINLSGSTVTTNAGCGIYTMNKSTTVNISGGSVQSGSYALRGAQGTIQLSGAPDLGENGIYLLDGQKITVTSALSNTSAIGITMASPGVFTNTASANLAHNDASKFKSDNGSYIVGKNADGQLLLGAPCSVTYDANNGSGAPTDSSSPYASGSIVSVLAKGSLARDGYTFAGWKIGTADMIYANSADNITGATESFTISGNTTLTAQWTAIPATAPTISVQPQDLTLTYGYTEGSLSVTAEAATDTTYNALAYQWYSCDDADKTNPQEISGAASANYAIPTGKNAGTTEYYYCVVTATRSDNGQTATATSNVATVTVNAATYTVTYKVVNGTWSDDSTTDQTETVQSGSKPANVPTGMKASEGFTGGAWDTDPTDVIITEAKTFTYTYAQKDSISQTVTFKVVNGSWNEGEGEAATEDKTVTLTGYEGDTLKLSADQIPAVGSKPNDTYKAGSWDVTPSTETAITEATTYTYTYAQKDSISQTVTFKVVNGSWNEGEGEAATEDKTVTLTGYEGDTLKLKADQIPAVGSKPNDTYKAGSWDVTPSTETAITEATTYTYTYAQKDSISQTVTFKVVNGSWNEGEGEAATEDKTVTLTGYEGDTLKLSADQIPAVGSKPNDTYKAGSWDVTPSTETAITGTTTYTYTYAQKDSISQTVTFKVVNGSWNEGEGEAATEDKTVTLTGYEGDTLKLKADQIPAVGSKPNDTYKAGSWDVTPSTETAITGTTTYTYTYAQKDSISQTVTFKVVNGSWNEGEGEAATEDKTVTLTGYEGDTLKLSADQIPAVGSKPNDTYKAGSWDVTPSTETAITEATTYTYTYAQKDSISQTVTFKVVNGSWNEGEGEAATEDKTVTLTGYEGDTLKLSADQIPAVGSKPNDTYKAGSWDVTLSTETAITEATTYTYTYAQKDSISQTVTFKVVNGSWNEGEAEAATEDKTVTLTGYEGDTLKLKADQIPAVGSKPNDTYKAGSWDVTPSTETAITEATTFTYTYAQKDSISQTVTFKVVNGSWNEGEGEAATEDKTVTLTGYEGDTLKLSADQIPAVGSKPNDTYKAGSWDVTLSTETAITEATTYTYTYAQKDSISQTVTFKVVNGSWNEGEGEAATEDKTVTLTGYEGDTLKLSADQIPAVGSKPNDTYKAGSWDVTPSTETAITEATTYTYTYTQKDSISQTVTFKVVNGSWNEGEGEAATEDKTVTLTGYEGDTLKLSADQIPAVGSKPNDTYKAGSWDVTPSTETTITEATTYTYTYAQKDSISQTVTFKVVNGSWNEGEGEAATEDKTVTLTGYEGDTLKLKADQIPAVGSKPNDTYKAGSWDVTPSTETAITEATTYTYTYTQKEKAVVTKAPKAKTLTYTGSAQKLVTAGEATGGTMYYALGTDAATSPAGDLYTTSIPAKTDAGTSYVWYKVVGDDNHNDSDAACVTVTINNAPHTHNWSDWNVATPATCVAKGKEKRTCSGCGKTETRDIDIDSRNHTGKTEIKGDIEATTTEEGYTGDTYCADCHVKLKAGEVIPKRKKEEPKKEKITAVTNFCDLRLRMDKRGKDSIKVKWAEKKDADGYMVYGGLCTGKEDEMDLLKTIKNNKTTSWTHKKLKEGTSYKYKVVAYKKVKGEKKSLYKSMAVHAFTKGGKYTVAKGVKVNKSEVKLKKGKTFQIEASEVKDEKKKGINNHRAICYESSNEKVATVSEKGRVKAKKKGGATIYAYSETGAFKKVKVTVK